MLISNYTVMTTATKAQIWRVWTDVETWKDWDHEIEFSRLDGPFKEGTTGCLKMHNSPILKTKITQVEPLFRYVFETKLFLATSVSTSIIDQVDHKTYVTLVNEIRGPLALFYVLLIGRGIKNKTPLEIERMLKKASQERV